MWLCPKCLSPFLKKVPSLWCRLPCAFLKRLRKRALTLCTCTGQVYPPPVRTRTKSSRKKLVLSRYTCAYRNNRAATGGRRTVGCAEENVDTSTCRTWSCKCRIDRRPCGLRGDDRQKPVNISAIDPARGGALPFFLKIKLERNQNRLRLKNFLHSKNDDDAT